MKKEDVIKTFNLLQQDKNVKKVFDADISARIPYYLHCCVYDFDREVWVEDDILYNYDLGGNCQTLKLLNERGACLMYYQIRPYLRSIHKLTKEELKELEFLTDGDYVDYCNKHHIDYRNLIPKGLALEAKEEMYEY